VIEENGERGHATPTPNELEKGQEEEEEGGLYLILSPASRA
jgi:hypothetical protein